MGNYLAEFKSHFNLTLVLFFIIISGVLYYVDRKKFIRNGYKKEEKVAKVLSYVYFYGSIGLYIVLQIFA